MKATDDEPEDALGDFSSKKLTCVNCKIEIKDLVTFEKKSFCSYSCIREYKGDLK